MSTKSPYKIENLNAQQIILLGHLKNGLTYKEIGKLVFMSHRTVEHSAQQLRVDLDARNMAHLISIAYRRGFLKL